MAITRDDGGNVVTLDDSELFKTHFSPTCTFCAHWHAGEGQRCDAFPNRDIPDSIWSGKSMHLTPVGGEKKDKSGQPICFQLVSGVKRTSENAGLLDAYAAANKKKSQAQKG